MHDTFNPYGPNKTELKNRSKASQFSLIFMLTLFTVTALFASLVQIALKATQATPMLILSIGFKLAVASSFVGGFCSYFIERRPLSIALGSIVGFGIGAFITLLGLIHEAGSARVNQVTFYGSGIIVAALLIMARYTKRIDGCRCN